VANEKARLKRLFKQRYNSKTESWAVANNMFWKYIGKRDKLGIAEISKDELFVDRYFLRNQVLYTKNFFEHGIHMNTDNFMDTLYIDPTYESWRSSVESYIKTVWITNDLLEEGDFQSPMGAYWNPFNERWRIHPGGIRQVIAYLFCKDKITCVTFNSGRKIKYKKVFNSMEDMYKYFGHKNINLDITQLKNLYIPNVHFNQNVLKTTINDWHKLVKEFYSTTEITGNFDITSLGYSPSLLTNKKRKINVEVETEDLQTVLRVWMLLPTQRNFDNYGIKISEG